MSLPLYPYRVRFVDRTGPRVERIHATDRRSACAAVLKIFGAIADDAEPVAVKLSYQHLRNFRR